MSLVDKGVISGSIGKEVFEEMFRTGKIRGAIVKERGLEQISDEGAAGRHRRRGHRRAPGCGRQRPRRARSRPSGFLVGQVMQKTKGKANPKLVNELLARLVQQ